MWRGGRGKGWSVRWRGGGLRGVELRRGVLVGSGGASTGVLATSSTVSPPTRKTLPRRVTVRRGGYSGEAMPLDAGRVLLHVGAAATVAPVPLATGSW